MKKVYLHIGMHKTGSSSLQHFLNQNRERFREQGVLYPRAGLHGPAQHLLAMGMELEFLQDRMELDLAALYGELEKEIEKSSCSKIILSSEYFNLLRNFDQLPHFFSKHDITIIIYLREPAKQLESMYKQQLAAYPRRATKTFNEFFEELPPFLYDYGALMAPWSAFFGEHKICVRSYENARKLPHGVISDFSRLLKLNIEHTTYEQSDAQKNISIENADAPFARSLNHLNLPEEAYNELLNGLLRVKRIQDDDGLIAPELKRKIKAQSVDPNPSQPQNPGSTSEDQRQGGGLRDQENCISSMIKLFMQADDTWLGE